MLDAMTPEAFAEWAAFDAIEPVGVEKVCRVLALGFTALCHSWGAKDVEPSHFMPGEEPEERVVSPAEATAIFSKVMGSRGNSSR